MTDPATTRKRRGGLIEPIYLCVGIAFVFSGTHFAIADVLREPVGRTFDLVFEAPAVAATLIALGFLIVELFRDR